MLKYANKEFNLDKLFQFDILKDIIIELSKRQDEIEKNMINITNAGNQITNITGANDLNKITEGLDTDEPVDKKDYEKRLDQLEKKVATLPILEKMIRAADAKATDAVNKINICNNKIEDLKKGVDDNKNEIGVQKERIDALEEKINDLSKKLGDFNIFTQVPPSNNDSSPEGLLDFEKKIFKKFGFIDDKIKELGAEIEKLKKTNNDIQSANGSSLASLASLKDILDKIQKEIEEQKEKNKNFDKTLADLETFRNDTKNTLGTERKEDNSNDIELLWKKINDHEEQISNLEKKLAHLPETLKLEEMGESINGIKKALDLKLERGDIEEIADKLANANQAINDLKDFSEQQNEINGKRNQAILNLTKKIESITSLLALLQNEGIPSKSSPSDFKNAIDMSSFQDALKKVNLAIIEMQKECDEFRRNFEDIFPVMKKLASVDDLKNLEEVLKAMLEEYKLLAQRRFADKIETQKNFKMIDSQIKHMIADYMKKAEKENNWLLASKPLGGNKCASCEAYLGELNNKWEYLPWNKYPTREFTDKTYRMGNGFSRMLQKLSLDVRKSDDVINSVSLSGDELDQNNTNGNKGRNNSEEKKKNILPKVNQSQKFAEDVKGNVANSEEGNPKVLKIYKKVK